MATSAARSSEPAEREGIAAAADTSRGGLEHGRPRWVLAVAVLPILLAGGCTASRYLVLDPPREALTSFEVLQINDFRAQQAGDGTSPLAAAFANELYEKILKERATNPRGSVFRQVVRETEDVASVLVLDGRVIAFDEGSQKARYYLPFLAGKATATIEASFTNKETGAQVLRTIFQAEFRTGYFGGTPRKAFAEVVEGLVDAFIEYFHDYLAGTPPPAPGSGARLSGQDRGPSD